MKIMNNLSLTLNFEFIPKTTFLGIRVNLMRRNKHIHSTISFIEFVNSWLFKFFGVYSSL